MFTGTLPVNAQESLALLGKTKCLPKGTYLAGGSGLALHFGHRMSEDFDFFTPNSFDQDALVKKLA
ncbi:nucleotidyl transferase AbiEii/AbiGii toxin family protein, partial [Candidatus Microgenomates bacterium]|nr:nucleotidyl transferase AbiEii/AbiGii toxin family protein [Candidatus Microgenomates bacterium]